MSILLENLTKRYGAQTVVKQVSLEIADGELFILLGASGSGKSTILRMIAGLSTCDEGRIVIKGRDVTQLAPQARGTGFVFQNYSIFRHMTLAQNVEFGLKIRGVPPAQRAEKSEELLDLVDLTGLGDRYAHQISGGQQQRVALARALAYEPAILLLDEPLAALDVKIRAQLRRSFKAIQRRLQVTTMLVTHDQEEAYELGDRIGVMERGTLLEIGAPEQLYKRPRTFYGAGFVGSGTILAGRVVNGLARFGSLGLPIPPDVPHEEGASVELLFRPEQVELSAAPKADNPALGQGTLIEQTFSGAMRRVRLRLPRPAGTRQVSPALPFGEPDLIIEALLPVHAVLPEDRFWVNLREWTVLEQGPPRLLVVDPGSGPLTVLKLAEAFGTSMSAAVTVLGMLSLDSRRDARAAVVDRAREAGLAEFDLRTGNGSLSQQIAAQCANALFEAVVLPRSLDGSLDKLDQDVVGFVESADLPIIVAGQGNTQLSRVLICTHAGEPGKSDVRYGGRLARQLGARVTLLHVTRSEAGPQRLVRRHLEQAVGSLRAMEVESEILTPVGEDCARSILQIAGENDLVVVGGHGPQARSVFGHDDITIQVLAGARCPVAVIPWDG